MKSIVAVLCLTIVVTVVECQFPQFTAPPQPRVTFPPQPKVTFPPHLKVTFPKVTFPQSRCDPKGRQDHYLACCVSQLSKSSGHCSHANVFGQISPKNLSSLSCRDLQGLFKQGAGAADLTKLLPGLRNGSSPCLSHAFANGFKHVYGQTSQWNSSVFKKVPPKSIASFDYSSLTKLNPKVLQDKASLGHLSQAMKMMTPDQAQGAVKGIVNSYGTVSSWTKTTLENLLKNIPQMVCSFPPTDIKKLRPENVADNIKHVSTALKQCGQNTRGKANVDNQFFQLYQGQKGHPSTWDKDTFKNLGSLKSQLTPSSLYSLKSSVLSDDDTLPRDDTSFSPHQKLAIAAGLKRRMNGMMNMSVADKVSDLLGESRAILSSLDASDILGANCSDIASHFLQSTYRRAPKLSKQTLYERVKKCGFRTLMAGAGQVAPTSDMPSAFTPQHIHTLSDYFSFFSSSDLEKMGENATKGAFQEMSAGGEKLKELDHSQSRALLRAMKLASQTMKKSTVNFDKLGPLVRALTPAEAKGAKFSLSKINDTQAVDLKDRPDLRRVFADQALKTLGNNFSDKASWPSNSKFGELGSNVVTGFNRTTIMHLPSDGYDGFVSQASRFRGYSQGQAKQYIKRYSLDFARSATEDQVRSLGSFVCQMNTSMLNAMPDMAKMQVTRNLGQAQRLLGHCGNISRIQKLLNFAVHSLKKSSATSKLNASDVQMLGNLAQHLSSDTLDRMDKADLEASTYQLAHSQETGDVDSRLKKVAGSVYKKSKDSTGSLSPSLVRNLGRAACHLPSNFFNTLSNKTKFGDQIDSLGHQKCQPTSTASKSLVQKAKMHWGDVSQWNETHIRRLNQSIPAMNISDMRKLHPKVVQNTLETLGKTNISREQGAVLGNKLPGGKSSRMRRQATDDKLSKSQVKNLGRIACSMSPSRYAHHLNDTDVLCSLSKQRCYNSSQKMEVLMNLKKPANFGSQVSLWKPQTVDCLGSFATGMSESDIGQISYNAFGVAMRNFGKQNFSQVGQRKALFDRMTKYFSMSGGRKEADVSNMGNLAGTIGAGRDDQGCKQSVAGLSKDDIGAINVSAVPYLYNLKCFSPDQLKSFDGEQARAVTNTQKQELSSEQQTALAVVSCDPDPCESTTGSPGSGAQHVFASFSLLLSLALLAIAL